MPFNNVPLEHDTCLLEQFRVQIDGYELLYQRWHWDGVPGESLIFQEEQVAALTDNQLYQLVLDKGLISAAASITITRDRQGYAFLNYFERT